MILDVDPTQKKKKGAAWFELDEDLDEEWIKEHQQFLIEEQRTKITKKFEKDNEKLKANKEKPMPEKELKERLQAVKELEAKFKKENKTKKVEAEGRGPTVDKLMKQVEKFDERVKVLETQAEDRDGNKEVALGTSKIVSTLDDVCIRPLLTQHRTTLILVSLSSFPRSLTCPLRSSSPRLSATSSDGPSSRLKMRMTGPSSSIWRTSILRHTKRLFYFDLQSHFTLLFFTILVTFFLLSCKNTRPGGTLNPASEDRTGARARHTDVCASSARVPGRLGIHRYQAYRWNGRESMNLQAGAERRNFSRSIGVYGGRKSP